MSKTSFLVHCYGPAKTVLDEYDIPLHLSLAQAAWESQWGTTSAARSGNSLFGMKAKGKASQYWDGFSHVGSYRSYETYLNSFLDWAQTIKDHYPDVYDARHDDEAYCNALGNSRYAESPTYGSNMLAMIKSVKKRAWIVGGLTSAGTVLPFIA